MVSRMTFEGTKSTKTGARADAYKQFGELPKKMCAAVQEQEERLKSIRDLGGNAKAYLVAADPAVEKKPARSPNDEPGAASADEIGQFPGPEKPRLINELR